MEELMQKIQEIREEREREGDEDDYNFNYFEGQHYENRRIDEISDIKELKFYNQDNSHQVVVVNRNTCARGLCHQLQIENEVETDVHWSIFEHWSGPAMERNLEDHERILDAYDCNQAFCPKSWTAFFFRTDHRKYEFFTQINEYFPLNMIDIRYFDDAAPKPEDPHVKKSLQEIDKRCPIIFGISAVRSTSNVWGRVFISLIDKKIYGAYETEPFKEMIYNAQIANSKPHGARTYESDKIHVVADLKDYKIYRALNPMVELKSPSDFAIYLRPTNAPCFGNETAGHDLVCICFQTKRLRECWITAMRMAKYGGLLAKNYRLFRQVQLKSDQPSNAPAPYPSNPRKTSGSSERSQLLRYPATGALNGLPPWFHANITRRDAVDILTKYPPTDGVFLIRESIRYNGSFILSMKMGSEITHIAISILLDEFTGSVCCSLDGGKSRFYTLQQLVEFYQLNPVKNRIRLNYYISPCIQ